ncbi:MAG: methyltransferase domain-containing protein [Acidobacteria bacterium]|nr:methyltransferase domain-containing protein [Acidobacteriota bacterium]
MSDTERGEETPASPPAGKPRPGGRAAGPVRRLAARFALVTRETMERRRAVRMLGTRLDQMSETLKDTRARMWAMPKRTDLVMGQIWLRAETADARAATEIQRLKDEVRRIQEDNARILALFETQQAPAGTACGAGDLKTGALDRAIASRVPAGDEPRAETIRRMGRYVEHFRSREPVVVLGCRRGEMLEVLQSYLIDSYGVETDPASIEFCAESAFTVEKADPVSHLASLPEASVGAVFCGIAERLAPGMISDLTKAVARALRPGGILIVESTNPANPVVLARALWGRGDSVPVPPEDLARLAREAGLVVEGFIAEEPPPGSPREPARLPEDLAGGDLAEVVASLNRLATEIDGLANPPKRYALAATKPG